MNDKFVGHKKDCLNKDCKCPKCKLLDERRDVEEQSKIINKTEDNDKQIGLKKKRKFMANQKELTDHSIHSILNRSQNPEETDGQLEPYPSVN